MAKRGYHHGNLREALIDGCLTLIEKRGPTGFTLSEAAREAGVTPAAVYRHFEGREDLIAAAALQGYEMFGDLMEYAYGDGQPSALKAFEATGRAYLAFARKYPGHYIAMFESGISINRSSELHAVATRAMGVLEKAAEQLSQHIPAEKRPPPQMFSAHIWALSHGVVELFARASPGTKSPFPPEDLLETGIGIYLRGLGLIAPDSEDPDGR
ncbi:TetR/AcrR family transcriptional regulator [Yoonia sp.]|uniref:TetR/AcrR family transcriptional regulator n=1 Tax=Yoonia sp. TaxID=2212373 RepID=UPI002DFA55FA|nr:TetR/AcrR family transcriptional regulator [Yoonia sp.]